jgi:hypothetical protein
MDNGNTPIAEQTLYLPPTQSQNPNTFSEEIPNLDVASKLVLQAHIWRDTISLSSALTPYFLGKILRKLLVFF